MFKKLITIINKFITRGFFIIGVIIFLFIIISLIKDYNVSKCIIIIEMLSLSLVLFIFGGKNFVSWPEGTRMYTIAAIFIYLIASFIGFMFLMLSQLKNFELIENQTGKNYKGWSELMWSMGILLKLGIFPFTYIVPTLIKGCTYRALYFVNIVSKILILLIYSVSIRECFHTSIEFTVITYCLILTMLHVSWRVVNTTFVYEIITYSGLHSLSIVIFATSISKMPFQIEHSWSIIWCYMFFYSFASWALINFFRISFNSETLGLKITELISIPNKTGIKHWNLIGAFLFLVTTAIPPTAFFVQKVKLLEYLANTNYLVSIMLIIYLSTSILLMLAALRIIMYMTGSHEFHKKMFSKQWIEKHENREENVANIEYYYSLMNYFIFSFQILFIVYSIMMKMFNIFYNFNEPALVAVSIIINFISAIIIFFYSNQSNQLLISRLVIISQIKTTGIILYTLSSKQIKFITEPNYVTSIKFGIFKFYANHIYYGIELNQYSFYMLFLIWIISSSMLIFSTIYMSEEPHYSRFIGNVFMFVLFMQILVVSPSMIQLFIGWEGVGVCSYLLVSYWSTRIQAVKASNLAIIQNGLGDGMILGALVILYKNGISEWSNLSTLQWEEIGSTPIEVAVILAITGCFIKSAQIVFHSWLPAAMEGPTPVSALIHAATMVTAGVFLLIRISPLINQFQWASNILTVFGGMTAVICAFWACWQICIKKIIAMSTCSQLGYMVMCCGLGLYKLALTHLVFHGVFKGLLFLTSANIINVRAGEQNLFKGGWTNYGNMMGSVQYICTLSGSLAIMGIPFFTGFYSKELIIESSSLWYFHLPFISTILAALFTIIYSIRLQYHEFFGEFNGWKFYYSQLKNKQVLLIIPICWLSFAAIFCGYIYFKGMGVGAESTASSSNVNVAGSLMFFYIIILSINLIIEFIHYKWESSFINMCTEGKIKFFTLKSNFIAIIKKNTNIVEQTFSKYIIQPAIYYSNLIVRFMGEAFIETLSIKITNSVVFKGLNKVLVKILEK